MTLVLAAGFSRLTVFALLLLFLVLLSPTDLRLIAFIALAAPVAAVVKGGFITFVNGLRLTLGFLVFALLLLFLVLLFPTALPKLRLLLIFLDCFSAFIFTLLLLAVVVVVILPFML